MSLFVSVLFSLPTTDWWGGRMGPTQTTAAKEAKTIGDFTASRPSQIITTNAIRTRWHPPSSEMVGDKSGKSGGFLFSRWVPDFCADGRQSFPTYENWNLYCTSKLLGSSPSVTNKNDVCHRRADKIWDGQETVKSPIWAFPTYEN